MKQLLLLITLIGSMSMRAKATDKDIIPFATIQSFQKKFSNAKEVSWSESRELYKADFLLNGQYVSAYFTADGNFFAAAKKIVSTQLPFLLSAELKEKFADYWISDLMEVSTEDGVTYYVTLEDADNRVVLQSFGRSWSNFQKFNK
ncbi:MAG TPA: hypothetical protein VHK91_10925 [Flavisolibacter sp.]|jgi:hypothetical protein|nr:hypothetical protein [Flavisolibacter sp.]